MFAALSICLIRLIALAKGAKVRDLVKFMFKSREELCPKSMIEVLGFGFKSHQTL